MKTLFIVIMSMTAGWLGTKDASMQITVLAYCTHRSDMFKIDFLCILNMKAIVVTPKSDTEFKFLADLLKKPGIGTSTLPKAEIEDIGMIRLLSNVDKSKRVSRNEIMKKLTAQWQYH